MSELSVFYEKGVYFGVFREDYTEMHSMDYFFLKRHHPLNYIWSFDFPLQNMQGSICNIGAMLDESLNDVGVTDEVFFVRNGRTFFGVKLRNRKMTLRTDKHTCVLKDNTGKSDIANFSLNMLIKNYITRRNKKIYIIDPNIVSNAFRMIL